MWVARACTLSPHFVPFTLRPHTLSLRFVESPDTEVRRNENDPAQPGGGERGAFSFSFSFSSSSSSSSSRPGTADPAGTTGTADGYRQDRQVATGSMAIDKCCPMWRGHSCLRTSTRADRNVCPTLPRSIACRASRDGFALPVLARLCGSCPCTRRQSATAVIQADRRRIPRLYPAPSGLVVHLPIPQGVALGWYITPLQGCHQRHPQP